MKKNKVGTAFFLMAVCIGVVDPDHNREKLPDPDCISLTRFHRENGSLSHWNLDTSLHFPVSLPDADQ